MIKRFTHPLLLAAFLVGHVNYAMADETRLSLAGTWKFRLDAGDVGVAEKWYQQTLSESIKLPGSLQEQGYGNKPSADTVWTAGIGAKLLKQERFLPYTQSKDYQSPFWLTPERHYVGAAWYQRTVTIPNSRQGRRFVLYLERPHWQTTVWVDSRQAGPQGAGTQNALGTPHEYDLTDFLSAGEHTLTIRVDNSMIVNVGNNAHSVSDQTQSNWNGIVGDIELRTTSTVWFEDIQVYPDVRQKQIHIKAYLKNQTQNPGKGQLTLAAKSRNASTSHTPQPKQVPVSWGPTEEMLDLVYEMGPDCLLWNEFHPALYDLTLHLQGKDLSVEKTVSFGMRQLDIAGTRFTINDQPIFLRGTLECAIFPITGYPPTDVQWWKKTLKTARSWGLNHLRFHSWCPPKAAFTAADEMGFYFQVEASCWAGFGDGSALDTWIYEEGDRMLKEYGNHPSFILMAPSNEPGGRNRDAFLGRLVEHWAKKDSRRRFTAGSGWPALPQNQYHVQQEPRLQRYPGLRLTDPPQSATDYRDYITKMKIPTISHEIGQWCAYPDFTETSKYTGSLKARYLDIAGDMLNKAGPQGAGMGDLGEAFHLASGKFQALLYKEEIEAALRTPSMAGFQLLDLHDFPGQGYAPVGVLDPFWQPKGYITAAEYSRFCGPVVPLARMKKLVFTNDETFAADIDVCNYSGGENRIDAKWILRNSAGKVLASDRLLAGTAPNGSVTNLGKVQFPLTKIAFAEMLNLEVAFGDCGIANDWDFWVFPKSLDIETSKDVFLTQSPKEALEKLQSGSNVLFMPKPDTIKSDTLGSFKPIFWNRVTFPSQAEHTLGILCDPQHAALKQFPTESHTNWQWYDLLQNCKPIVLDDLPRQIIPIVRMIDDWFVCRKLGLVFEASVGQGKLIVCSIDLMKDLETRPVARQLRYSLIKYMQSNAFAPKTELTEKQLMALLRITK